MKIRGVAHLSGMSVGGNDKIVEKVNKGQTLVEVLVALSIAGIIISAITVVITASLNNARFSTDQNSATNYAQQGMEVVRQIRDNDLVGFRSYSGTYCLLKGATSLGSVQGSCSQNADAFTRSVTIQQSPGCSANTAKVSVTVAWSDGKCSSNTLCHSVPLISCLSTINTVTFLASGPTSTPVLTPMPTSTPVPASTPTPTFLPVPTATPTPVALLLSNLVVYDSTNLGAWSLQTNLQSGNTQYGDRSYVLTSVPSSLLGSSWVETAMVSKGYLGNPTVQFTINTQATVYVGFDTRFTTLPSWIDASWVNSGLQLVNSESTPRTLILYKKVFAAGTVSLGPVSDTSTSFDMYTVVVK